VAEGPDARLPSPGARGVIELQAGAPRDALTVPAAALLLRDGRLVVVVDAGGRARVQPVKIGMREDGRVEVLEGLAAGDRVAVSGAELLAPPPAATGGGEGAWLVLPAGSGPAIAAALPAGSVARPRPRAARVRLDAREALLRGFTLGRILAALDTGAPLPDELVSALAER